MSYQGSHRIQVYVSVVYIQFLEAGTFHVNDFAGGGGGGGGGWEL